MRITTLDMDPNVCIAPEETKWLADSNLVHRLVDLLHSPDADRQEHANIALCGLIFGSQLRLSLDDCFALSVFAWSTVEKVFQGIQTSGFAASSASLNVLVEFFQKCAAARSPAFINCFPVLHV
jgi:hypothetical protein